MSSSRPKRTQPNAAARPGRRSCGVGRGGRPLRSLEDVIVDYRARFQEGADEEVEHYARLSTLSEAIRAAAAAQRPDGKRQAHQYRIPRHVLASCGRSLYAVRWELAAARTFDGLWRVVREAIQPIRGVGELMVYDTSLRIGAHRRLAPERVYLHRGVRIGARNLGLDTSAESLAISDLPIPLWKLSPREAEDVLCIYKAQLSCDRSRRPRSKTTLRVKRVSGLD